MCTGMVTACVSILTGDIFTSTHCYNKESLIFAKHIMIGISEAFMM